jgi:Ca2+-binding EF-hand superfamily protein
LKGGRSETTAVQSKGDKAQGGGGGGTRVVGLTKGTLSQSAPALLLGHGDHLNENVKAARAHGGAAGAAIPPPSMQKSASTKFEKDDVVLGGGGGGEKGEGDAAPVPSKGKKTSSRKSKVKRKRAVTTSSPITTEDVGGGGGRTRKGPGILERYQSIMAEEESTKQKQKMLKQLQAPHTAGGVVAGDTYEDREFRKSFVPRFTGSTIQDMSTKQMMKLKRKTHFGKYKVIEVAPLIQLFKDLDVDESGEISMKEFLEAQKTNSEVSALVAGKPDHFFLTLDTDKSGQVCLMELLKAVFHDANKLSDIKDMVNYAEIVNIKLPQEVAKKEMSAEKLADLKALFQLYDKDKSGAVRCSSRMECTGLVR